MALGIRDGRIHTVGGLDPAELADRLGCAGVDDDDLLSAARELGRRHGIPETQAMGAAKEILQRALHQWLMDPERGLTIDEDAPPAVDGTTISITHALVELVLADTEDNVARSILPSRDTVLQRSSGFLKLYPPLRLSEEADLIVAGITGSATADEIAAGSSHDRNEVLRLEAALVATGILEASEPVIPDDDLEWPAVDVDDDGATRRRIPLWMIAAVAVALLLAIVLAALVLLRGDGAAATAVDGSGDWGVVVEMGCEPMDLQRMLRKRNLERKALRTVKADPASGDTCFRLIWGSFPSREAAQAAIIEVPSNLIEDGFEPHIIEIDDGDAASAGELGSGE